MQVAPRHEKSDLEHAAALGCITSSWVAVPISESQQASGMLRWFWEAEVAGGGPWEQRSRPFRAEVVAIVPAADENLADVSSVDLVNVDQQLTAQDFQVQRSSRREGPSQRFSRGPSSSACLDEA